jgi:CheY-like chemotaxis protein
MHTHNRILLVDDDPDDLEIFISAFKEIQPGIICLTANNGVQALDYLIQSAPPPSLVLMDVNMPVMNGLECLAEIKKINEFKSIPVVMLTTSNDPPSRKQSLKLGAKLFLTKAAALNDIKSQLRMVLEEQMAYGLLNTD